MFSWFRRFFKEKPFSESPKVLESTEDFQRFTETRKKLRELSHKGEYFWESDENILVVYIISIGKSPFRDDKDHQHAKNLLRKHQIPNPGQFFEVGYFPLPEWNPSEEE